MKGVKIALCVLAFLGALCLTLYPLASNYLAEKYQSTAMSDYVAAVSDMDDTSRIMAWQDAQDYNRRIAERAVPMDGPDAALYLNTPEIGYDSLLNLNNDGIMGYIRIPSINIVLPIYHGVEGETLEAGVGHMPGSSLPVGGDSTHTVLAAHSGLASQRMFSDLEQLQIGDKFFLSVLGETLAYEVDQILVVEPEDTTSLGILYGEDHTTLITCTPFGVNTHRLLVRGRQVPYVQDVAESIQPVTAAATSTWREQYINGITMGLCILLGGVVVPVLIWRIYRLYHPRRRYKHEMY